MNKIILTCPHCSRAWEADTPCDDEPIVCSDCDEEFFDAAEKVIRA